MSPEFPTQYDGLYLCVVDETGKLVGTRTADTPTRVQSYYQSALQSAGSLERQWVTELLLKKSDDPSI